MINFSQFLSEARLAPLYHGTGPDGIESILRDGLQPFTYQIKSKLLMARPNDYDDKSRAVYGVSLTRNPKFARRYKDRSTTFVIELDQQKLAQNYKIVPFQYWQSNYVARSQETVNYTYRPKNEYEEFVITNKAIDRKYFKSVTLYSSEIPNENYYKQMIADLKKKYSDINFRYVHD